MRASLQWFVGVVDKINEKMRFAGLVMLIMAFIMTYEVVARYVFNAPTKWAWDINSQLLCLIIVVAGGYAQLHKTHIRVDVIYSLWSDRKKAMVDFFTSFLPLLFLGFLLYSTGVMAKRAVQRLECAPTYFAPPIYPLKVLMVVGVSLFLLQVIADIIRNYLAITARKSE
jgi:TRAP-type mannitol/chloroaromatic compound transport system permease small subunit